MIVELVRQGHRVGVTAGSHKVICTLLDAICGAAAELSVPLKVVQKSNGFDECDHADVDAGRRRFRSFERARRWIGPRSGRVGMALEL